MKQSYTLLVLGVLLASNVCNAQIGGENTFEFLNLPSSSRISAAGGSLITIEDDDLSLAYNNPSVLNPSMNNHLSVSTMVYFGGINFGNISYARDFGKYGTYSAGMQYISYGKFPRTDPLGMQSGTVHPSEYALFVGGAIPYGKYAFGSNLKFIYSNLVDYNSVGIGLDLAANYTDTAKMFTASLVFRNIGAQIKPYTKGNQEGLPFDVQLGFSKRLKYVPFRLSVTIHNGYRWDIRYDDPNVTEPDNIFNGDDEGDDEKSFFVDKFFRHFIFGGELYLGKAVRLGLGYNHMRRQELRLLTRSGLAGFSVGFGVKIKQFQVNYSLAKYHSSFNSNHFTLNTNLNTFIKRGSKKKIRKVEG